MNLDIGTLIKKITGIFGKHSRKSVEFVRDVSGDWGKIVIVFAILFCATVAGHIYLFFSFSADAQKASEATVVNNASIQTTVTKSTSYYDGKEKRFSDLETNKLTAVDPSL
jgi:uncharacterized protein YpmB